MARTQELFSIGDVAHLFHLSVSSLRHYETIGLLTREYTDPATGYRYYGPRQFEVLNTIRYLRALDMPLGQIRAFLRNRDVGRIEQLLREQKAAVVRKQAELQRVERKIDNRLRQLHAAQTAAEIHRISQTWNAVGLIVMGLQANQCRELMQVTRKPIVFVDCYFDQGERYNNVGLDDEGGMRQMTEHLLKLGHRNMLFVGDQPVLWGVDARRLRGHQQALEAAGLAWQEAHYFCVSKDRKRRGEDYQRMLEYVRMLGCTVCLFISDYYAVEAIDFLLDQGVRVPEDISITGFDDNILSRVIRPRLTTVHQNVTRKAQTALHVLFDILDKTAKEPVSLVLPTRIIRGSSVKDLRLNRTMHTNLAE